MLRRYRQSGIEIVGSTLKDLKKVSEAILFLKKDDVWGNKLNNLKKIIIHGKNSYDNELFHRGRIWVCQLGTVRESSVVYLASLIAHEIYHVLQRKKGMDNVNSRMEPAAYGAQIRFLKKYGTKRDVWWVSKLLKEKHWEGQIEINKKGENRVYVSPFLKYLKVVRNSKIKLVNKFG